MIPYSLQKKKFFIREGIIRAFKRGIFWYIDGFNGFKVEKEPDKESDKESNENEEIDTINMLI